MSRCYLQPISLVVVYVAITEYQDQFPSFILTVMCYKCKKDRVTCDIKGNTQEHIRTSLVYLEVQSHGTAVVLRLQRGVLCRNDLLHVKLIQYMTRWQAHLLENRRVPERYYVSPAKRVLFELL